MSYIILARKFRPQQFDDLVGQDHVVTTLKNAFIQDRIAQSFLFVGPRGVGKTSTARILAKALNCERKDKRTPYFSCGQCESCQEITNGNGFDVLEVDGASNRGIDEVRDLRENVKFKPMRGSYKVYIIDEVHMLTQEAFNALLKTLEEPPPHVKFVFATTEPHKIPQTILSRCQRYDFRPIQIDATIKTLQDIAKKEKISIDEKTLYMIAKNSEGSLRDAESLLDKLSSSLSKKIVFKDALDILGLTDSTAYLELLGSLISRDTESVLNMIQLQTDQGRDLVQFVKGLIEITRDLLICKSATEKEKFIRLPKEDVQYLKALSEQVTQKEILYFITVIQNVYVSMKTSSLPRVNLEVALLKILSREDLRPIRDILNQINSIETSNVIPASKPTAPSPQKAKAQQKKAATKTKSAGQASSTDIVSIRSAWPQILKEIQNEKAFLGSCLAVGKPIEVQNGTLVIAFSKENSFQKETVEAEAEKELVEGHIQNCIGQTVEVQFILSETKVEESVPSSATEEKPKMDPIIESAMEIFQGKVKGEL